MSTEDRGELFREEQRFTQVWIWLIVLGIAGFAWWALASQVLLDQPFGDEPAADWVLWVVWLSFGIGLPLFLASMKLTVTVSYRAPRDSISAVRLSGDSDLGDSAQRGANVSTDS